MRASRWLVVGSLVVASGMLVLACGAFGGSDAKGGDSDSGVAVDAEGASDGTTPSKKDGGTSTDASAADGAKDACVAFVVPAQADTYLIDDGSHCNGPITFGNATVLHVQGEAGVPEMSLVRFPLTSVEATLLDAKASIVVKTSGAACPAGTCAGSAFAMRSDWAEATGDSKGADLCRRAFPSFGWTAALGQPIAQPGDYDTAAAGTMSFASGTWSSTPLQASAVSFRLESDGASGKLLSLLFTVAAASSLTFPSHDADGGMVMSVTRCE